MKEQNNIMVVQQMCEAFEQANLPVLLDLLAEDIEWFVSGSNDYVPLAGRYQGREQVLQIFQTVGQALEIHQFKAQDFIAQDDQVVVFGHAIGRVKPTNRNLEYDWIHRYTLRDGKVSYFSEYLDTAAIASAFQMS